MKIQRDVELPKMPNFIRSGKEGIDVGSLTDEQVEELIVEWTAAFKKHVIVRRNNLEEWKRLGR